MKYYRITAKLLSPLLIQNNRQSDTCQSISYLPGSTLRGALAAKFFLIRGGPEDKDFRTLFLDDPPSFPNLLPTDEKGSVLSRVLPMTSISCKRNPGFKEGDKHGVRDTLAPNAASRIMQASANEDFWKCPECGEDMKPFPGFWNGNLSAPCKFEPTILYHRHTGIDRDTGTIAPSIFFVTQEMADFRKDDKSEEYHEQYLSGDMFMNEEQLEILKTLIKDSLFAGADRTRGLGEIQLSFEEIPRPEVRLEHWNEKFKAKLKSSMGNNIPEDALSGLYFSIKLESHAILVDKFLRPHSEIEEFSVSDFKLILKMTKAQTIRGWQSAWNLPKPDDLSVAMGSIFLFQYNGDDPEKLRNLLNELAVSGIGLRREEGFGRISVCDELHTITEEVI
ncbi:type III-D CRISPR-associated RAMP protein Csx10 [Desulfonema magnum]|uniref:CRISPR-associated RAMP protein, Csx10 family n=1 Tax=Desulfonema magnum TaxID=45655 RepID=A0A975BV43_9BACT|nr:CRISPR-associated RAMP protein Csx10 [Desulfonema magnum]QTA92057.1 CRISPR-associated RAMP protein, Csx10 family [Desulfonema magnum]